jgi:hypothetical protein
MADRRRPSRGKAENERDDQDGPPGGFPVKLVDEVIDHALDESLNGGPEPMGIITWKHELLAVPFPGQWAA